MPKPKKKSKISRLHDRMDVKIVIVLALAFMFILPSYIEQEIINPTIRLYTNGTKIMQRGDEVVIHTLIVSTNDRTNEINSNTRATNIGQTWFQQKDVAYMKTLGLNAVEIHMLGFQRVSNSNGEVNEAYFRDWIDEWVQWCKDEQMYIVLNFQRFNPTPGSFERYGWYYVPNWFYSDYGKPTTFTGVAEVCLDFWDTTVTHMNDERENYYKVLEYTANRYKNNPWVIISPRNEPQHFIHKYAGETGFPSKLAVYDGYMDVSQTSINRIRAAGFDGLLFIEMPYAFTEIQERYDQLEDLEGDNIVWEYHNYVGNKDFSEWKRKVSGAKAKVDTLNRPFYLGEWAMFPSELRNTHPYEETTEAMMNYLDTLGISECQHSWGLLFGYPKYAGSGRTDAEVAWYIDYQQSR